MRRFVAPLMLVTLLLVACTGPDSHPKVSVPVPESVGSDTASQPAGPETARPGAIPSPPAKLDARQLLPAYAFVDGDRRWGYIDAAGRFLIQPRFDWVEEFEPDGLAIVRQGFKYGLINKDGRLVVTPTWDRIEAANDDRVRVLWRGESSEVVDAEGKSLFRAPRVTANFGSGLAPYQSDEGLFGYVNRAGKVVIPAQFQGAHAFADGKALVEVEKGSFTVIDTAGKQAGAFAAGWTYGISEGLIPFQERPSLRWGYASATGEVILPATFGRAEAFQDGLAVVSTAAPHDRPLKGLIDRQGRFVIPAQYEALIPLGDGLYAAAKPTGEFAPEAYMPMAILTREGRVLTEFRYYSPQPVTEGLISVSDGKETFFLDLQGRRLSQMPSLPGFGSLRLRGSLIRANLDGRVSYLSRDGQTIWQNDHTIALADGLRVLERKHQPDLATLVFYPEFAGLPDPQAQELLNQTLRDAFTRGVDGMGEPPATTDTGFGVRQLQGLVIIEETGYWYQWGAAHGLPSRNYYHVDARTGALYTLADLFKLGSNYTEHLGEIVQKQIVSEQRGVDEDAEVRPSHAFYVATEGLTIYYRPYEIASYAQGFIEFLIPWGEISDLIETNGPFWQSFNP